MSQASSSRDGQAGGQADGKMPHSSNPRSGLCPILHSSHPTALEIITPSIASSGNYRQPLDFRQYEGHDLANAAIAWFDRELTSLDGGQLRAIATIKDNKLQIPNFEKPSSSPARSHPPLSPKLMLEYVRSFNDLFFFGALEGLLRVEWSADKLQHPDHQGDCYSTTTDDARMGSPSVLLRIYTFPDAKHNLRVYNILWTLLHEMLCAYFQIYGCRSFVCHGSQTKHDTVGLAGFGQSWVNVARQMEKVFDRFGLSFGDVGWQFNEVWGMAIERSVALELRMARDAGINATTKMPWMNEVMEGRA